MTTATKIGITGTRIGLTKPQLVAATHLLGTTYRQANELHFGDCDGADSEIFAIAADMGFWTVAHPPIHDRYRAHCVADEVREPKLYLPRNVDIVDAADVVLAFPKEPMEVKRGGTWWTVRYARKVGKPLLIVWPDGTETP